MVISYTRMYRFKNTLKSSVYYQDRIKKGRLDSVPQGKMRIRIRTVPEVFENLLIFIITYKVVNSP